MRIIAGEWRGRRLRPLAGAAVRPTADRVREAWMSAMGGRFDGLRVLDLFAGSGALGLECLSRGAAHATFVERSRAALDVIRANVALVSAEDRSDVLCRDAVRFVSDWSEEPFDLALADPPYGRGYAGRLVEIFAESPFARELWVEHRSSDALPEVAGLRQRKYGDTTLTQVGLP